MDFLLRWRPDFGKYRLEFGVLLLSDRMCHAFDDSSVYLRADCRMGVLHVRSMVDRRDNEGLKYLNLNIFDRCFICVHI